jgi:hypothetical protein
MGIVHPWDQGTGDAVECAPFIHLFVRTMSAYIQVPESLPVFRSISVGLASTRKI